MSANHNRKGANLFVWCLGDAWFWTVVLTVIGLTLCMIKFLDLDPEHVKSQQQASSLYEEAIQARNRLILSLDYGEGSDAISAQEKADQVFKELEKKVAEMRRTSTHVPPRVAQMVDDGPLHLVIKTKEAEKTETTSVSP